MPVEAAGAALRYCRHRGLPLLLAALLLLLPPAAAAAAQCLVASRAAARAGDCSQRQLYAFVTPNDTQTSNTLDPELNPISEDMPLDQPPLVRTAAGWEPEGVHLTLWASDSILVSWQTGEPRVGPTAMPPTPHNSSEVQGLVRYGPAAGQYDSEVQGSTDLTYTYSYAEDAGGMTYQSPILHHVLLQGLTPGQTYHYIVGGTYPNGTAAPASAEFNFTLPGSLPLRLGIVGDLGQSYNSSDTLAHLTAHTPDVVAIIGDLCYADLYRSNQTDAAWQFVSPPSSQQLRWDSWARLMQPLLAHVPMVHVGGNHEVELLVAAGNATFTAYNARYPAPTNADRIVTAPNNAPYYLNASNSLQFANQSEYEPHNGYWSVELPGLRLVALNNYLPYGPGSRQYDWAANQLSGVNRTATPWLVVLVHGGLRHNYGEPWGLFKELEEFVSIYEPLFYRSQVDVVYSGHVHAYERTLPMYNYSVDPCGPVYTTIGDGGNVEGPERRFVDVSPPDYCSNISLYQQPSYQPTATGQPLLTFQDGLFCPTSQPAWSAMRDPSFGHGVLTVMNGSLAEWQWYRNQDGVAVSADQILLEKDPACPSAPAPAPGANGGSSSNGSGSGGGGSTGSLPAALAGVLAACIGLLMY